MRRLVLGIAAAMIAVPSVSFAQDAAPAKEKEKKICRSDDANTGSRLTRSRVCKTQAQWDADRDRAGRDLDKARAPN